MKNCSCAFCVFKAIKIQNGHCLNVQMKRARNSDYNTCEKVKSDFQNRNRIQIAMMHFFWCSLQFSTFLFPLMIGEGLLGPKLCQAIASSKLCQFTAIQNAPLNFWEFREYVIYSKMVIRDCRKTPRLLAGCPRKETELLVTRPPSQFSQVEFSNVDIIL